VSEKNKWLNNMLDNPNGFYKDPTAISNAIKIEEQKKQYLSMLTKTEGENVYPFEKGVVFLSTEEQKK
jgi:hypothetical protein